MHYIVAHIIGYNLLNKEKHKADVKIPCNLALDTNINKTLSSWSCKYIYI